tara:strand:- start:386 stop:715 length:330 start_codon:yes stop_codon:yes gene_type:complete
MDSKKIRSVFTLPDGCPIPGAIYRRKLPSECWEFATITALQVLPKEGWTATLSSVRYGDEHITKDVNKLDKFELHSLPNMVAVAKDDSKGNSDADAGVDELDMLLAVGA